MIYKTKESIKEALINSLEEFEGGIKVKNYPDGSHRYWLTGDMESYNVHCFGSGQRWRDQDDDCNIQDIDKLVDYLWEERARIIEMF